MSKKSYQVLTTNFELSNNAIEYFTAEIANPQLFEEIKRIGIEKSKVFNRPNGETYINLGYLSLFDFMMYMGETKQIRDGIMPKFVEVVIHKLEEEGIINSLPENFGNLNDRRYKASGNIAKFLYERGLIINVIGGWRFIIERYCNSVVKIEHKAKSGDYSIGTGFYYAACNSNIEKHLIITNKHVLENAKSIKVFTKDDVEIKYSSICTDKKRDIGFIELDSKLSSQNFHFNSGVEVLSELITIGYPSIPMTKQAYQVYHKGELNSLVEDYYDNKLFLFSAKTSSGNSGSPIIDKYGMIIGIVTEELFEQEQFFQKGKLPYYAGIPTEEIICSVNENIFNQV